MNNIVMAVFGAGVIAVGSMLWSIKDSSKDINAMRAGGNSSTKYLGAGSKAEQLKDKPRAQDPMGVKGGIMAAVGAGLISKIPKGAKNVAKLTGTVGGKIPGATGKAFNLAKIGIGGVESIGEAINKKTGLTKKISGFIKPIGKKVRFKANSAAGFLKDQLETEGDRIKNRFKETKETISSNLPPSLKRKIRGIQNKAKLSATIAKERAKYHLNEFGETIDWNRRYYENKRRRLAEGFKNTKAATMAALQDTWGGRLAQEGINGLRNSITAPAVLPSNVRFTLAPEGINNANTINAPSNIRLINKDSRKLLTQTIDENEEDSIISRYYTQRYKHALTKVSFDNDNIAQDEVKKLLRNSPTFHSLMEKHINKAIGSSGTNPQKQKERNRIINAIANDLDGNEAKDYLSKKEREKLLKVIEEKQDLNTRSTILDVKDSLINEYKKNNPEKTLAEAAAAINQDSKGIIENLLKQGTQHLAEQNRVQNTIQETSNSNQTPQVAQAIEATTTQQQVASSSNTTQQTTSNINNTNTQQIEKRVEIHETKERVIEKVTDSSKININMNQLSDDISKNIENYIKNLNADSLRTFQAALSDKEPKESKVLDDLYRDIGGGDVTRGKEQFKKLYRQEGTFDRINKQIEAGINKEVTVNISGEKVEGAKKTGKHESFNSSERAKTTPTGRRIEATQQSKNKPKQKGT